MQQGRPSFFLIKVWLGQKLPLLLANKYSIKVRSKDKNKEEAIVQETIEIVYRTGIAGIKMSKLAKNVGVSPSTLYVYFSTKEELINSVGRKLLQKISQEREKSVIKGDTYQMKVKAIWLNLLSFLLNNEKEVNFIDQWKQSPYFNTSSEQVWKENKKTKSELFQEGINSGILKDIDEYIIYAILAGIAKEFVNLIKLGKLKKDKKTMDYSFTIVWDALKR